MHEEVIVRDLRRRLGAVAAEARPHRIVRVAVRLGSLSHFTEASFRGVWPRVVEGTGADGAELAVATSEDPEALEAQGVLLVDVVVDDADVAPSPAVRPPIEPRPLS